MYSTCIYSIWYLNALMGFGMLWLYAVLHMYHTCMYKATCTVQGCHFYGALSHCKVYWNCSSHTCNMFSMASNACCCSQCILAVFLVFSILPSSTLAGYEGSSAMVLALSAYNRRQKLQTIIIIHHQKFSNIRTMYACKHYTTTLELSMCMYVTFIRKHLTQMFIKQTYK